MNDYLRIIAAVLLAIVVIILLGKYSKEMTVLLSMVVCAAVMTAGFRFLEPILGLLDTLQVQSNLDRGYFRILLKSVGVGMIGEMAALICADGGSGTLAKAVEMLTSLVVLWLSVPLMTALLELVLKIAGEL
jgi:stage III sporulation protein AD